MNGTTRPVVPAQLECRSVFTTRDAVSKDFAEANWNDSNINS